MIPSVRRIQSITQPLITALHFEPRRHRLPRTELQQKYALTYRFNKYNIDAITTRASWKTFIQ
eukprot:scaffold37737_cov185-Skeletonema_marinoi.AAC.2